MVASKPSGKRVPENKSTSSRPSRNTKPSTSAAGPSYDKVVVSLCEPPKESSQIGDCYADSLSAGLGKRKSTPVKSNSAKKGRIGQSKDRDEGSDSASGPMDVDGSEIYSSIFGSESSRPNDSSVKDRDSTSEHSSQSGSSSENELLTLELFFEFFKEELAAIRQDLAVLRYGDDTFDSAWADMPTMPVASMYLDEQNMVRLRDEELVDTLRRCQRHPSDGDSSHISRVLGGQGLQSGSHFDKEASGSSEDEDADNISNTDEGKDSAVRASPPSGLGVASQPPNSFPPSPWPLESTSSSSSSSSSSSTSASSTPWLDK